MRPSPCAQRFPAGENVCAVDDGLARTTAANGVATRNRVLRRRGAWFLIFCGVLVLTPILRSSPAVGARDHLRISISGKRFVDGGGQKVVLRGLNTSGTEYACVSEHSIFDGAAEESARSIAAMRSWHVNAARVQLNESCWLGVQGVSRADSGVAYRRAIERYVSKLNAAGMYVIIDMHYSSEGGRAKATSQEPMPDERYAPAFWHSVAETFKSNGAVIFDLFNEPYPNGNVDSDAAWKCVLAGSAGGTCAGLGYRAAGMQQLVKVVRATGARNVIMVGGPQYAGDLDRWRRYEPHDRLGQLAASIHIYWNTRAHPDWSPCYLRSCWKKTVAPVAEHVPVVVGEFGELDCGDSLYLPFLRFAAHNGLSYLGWAWFAGSCAHEPSLIRNYRGIQPPSGSDTSASWPDAGAAEARQAFPIRGLARRQRWLARRRYPREGGRPTSAADRSAKRRAGVVRARR